jgi:hypothetical protein
VILIIQLCRNDTLAESSEFSEKIKSPATWNTFVINEEGSGGNRGAIIVVWYEPQWT